MRVHMREPPARWGSLQQRYGGLPEPSSGRNRRRGGGYRLVGEEVVQPLRKLFDRRVRWFLFLKAVPAIQMAAPDPGCLVAAKITGDASGDVHVSFPSHRRSQQSSVHKIIYVAREGFWRCHLYNHMFASMDHSPRTLSSMDLHAIPDETGSRRRGYILKYWLSYYASLNNSPSVPPNQNPSSQLR
jgi:hypothetical protein